MKYRVTQNDIARFSSAEGVFPVVKGIVDLPEGSAIEAEFLDNGTVVPVGVGIIDPDEVAASEKKAAAAEAKKAAAAEKKAAG